MGEPIPAALDGERVDRVVAMFADVSRAAAANAIENGLIRLDGHVVTTRSRRVAVGMMIEIDPTVGEDPAPLSGDAGVQVNVVHVDDDVIVVDKAVGEVVHPGSGHSTGTIVQGLLALYPEIATVGESGRPGVVHRLDKGTSGVLVVARTERAYDSLTDQLRERTVQRTYLTIAWGGPESHDGVIDAPIGRAIRDPTRMVVRNDGKPARTAYHVLAVWGEPAVSLLQCRLQTGRTHQIRVHLEAIGHPVVGDDRYSGGRTGLDIARPALHAAQLGFDHPSTGEHMMFTSPLPEDMTAVLAHLGSPDWGVVPT